MSSSVATRIRLLVLVAGLLGLPGCGRSGDDQPASNETPAAAVSNRPTAAAAEVPEACTLFSRAELEEIVGWELREGEADDAPDGISICDFESPPRLYVTRTFPDPALPPSVDFSSLTINTHSADAERFADFRLMLGDQAEDVPGIGDGAYFSGPDLLYVRVGDLGFSARIYTNAGTDADWSRVREVMLQLARLGEARMRAL
jgi:hypothetical protein